MSQTSNEIIQEHAERGADPQELIDFLVEGAGDYEFSGQELVAAVAQAHMDSLQIVGTLLGGVIQAIGGDVSQEDLGAQLVNTFRVAMSANLYDAAVSVVEADVVEEG